MNCIKTNPGGFYRNFFHIYVALVLQNVITISVNLADNIMLGFYSEAALAGVAAVNQIQFIYQQLLMALGDGLVIAVLLFLLVSIMPLQILQLFTTDQPIISEGVRYLSLICFLQLRRFCLPH